MIILTFLLVESIQNENGSNISSTQALNPLTNETKPIVIETNKTIETQNLNKTSETLISENKIQEGQQKGEEKNETEILETQKKENTDEKAAPSNNINKTTNITKIDNVEIVKQPNSTKSSENSTSEQPKAQNTTDIRKEDTKIDQKEDHKEQEQDIKNKIEDSQKSKSEAEENTTKVEEITQTEEKSDKKPETEISTNKNELAVIESKKEEKKVEESYSVPERTKIVGQKIVINKDGEEKIEKEHKDENKNNNRLPIAEVKNTGMNPVFKVIICGVILAILGTAGYVAFKTISQSPRQATLEESVPFKFSMNQENDHKDLSRHGFSPL